MTRTYYFVREDDRNEVKTTHDLGHELELRAEGWHRISRRDLKDRYVATEKQIAYLSQIIPGYNAWCWHGENRGFGPMRSYKEDYRAPVQPDRNREPACDRGRGRDR